VIPNGVTERWQIADLRTVGLTVPYDPIGVHQSPLPPPPTIDRTPATISSTTLHRRLLLADMSSIALGLVIAFLIEAWLGNARARLGPQVLLVAATLPAWIVAWHAARLDRARYNERIVDEARNIVVASVIVVMSILTLAFIVGFDGPTRLWVGSAQVAVVMVLLLERRVARSWFTRLRRASRVTRRTLIVGTDDCAVRLKQRLDDDPALGYEVVGFVEARSAGIDDGSARSGVVDNQVVDKDVVDYQLIDTQIVDHQLVDHQVIDTQLVDNQVVDGAAGLGVDAVFRSPTGRDGALPILGTLDEIEAVAEVTRCCGVMISLQSVPEHDVNVLTRRLTDDGLHVELSTSLLDIDVKRLRVQDVDHRAMIYVEPTIRTGWRRLAKRAFDVSVASAVMVLSAPIVALAVAAIVIESGRPFLFRQTRVGMHGEHFEILKLRTMVCDAEARRADLLALNEADGPLFKIGDDPRVTRVGRFLRKASIDELPQLWNVMRGDMSLVGPRPALPDEVSQWSPELRDRLRVLPGITGLWQVSGRALASFDDYKRLDLYYVDNWSLRHDITIVWRTIGAVLRTRGAN